MKLARFSHAGQDGIGIVNNGIIPVAKHLPSAPGDMIDVIAAWNELDRDFLAIATEQAAIGLDEVRLLAPIPHPPKVFGIGLNYEDHIAESGLERPKDQLWFSKPHTAVTGPFDPIALPRVSTQLDYEAELVVVVGKHCRYADRAGAADAIFGYCVGNDVSVRDWQFRTSQFTLGKSFDTHAPHGPWIVTRGDIDPMALDIECRVNGELRQSSNSSRMIFDPVSQIAYLSQVMTLEPGDLIFTGTPAGVGSARKPPLWLTPGDVVSATVAAIGTITNTVVPE